MGDRYNALPLKSFLPSIVVFPHFRSYVVAVPAFFERSILRVVLAKKRGGSGEISFVSDFGDTSYAQLFKSTIDVRYARMFCDWRSRFLRLRVSSYSRRSVLWRHRTGATCETRPTSQLS